MKKFLALPKEKQQRIIEAGFQCFGKMGYKKASAQDIAAAAEISKGMIFHYFGSKKGMYQHLINVSYAEIMEAFKNGFNPEISDFFDRILMLTKCKVDCLKKHPSLLSFLASLCSETDPEVLKETQAVLENGNRIRLDAVLTNSDKEKFKSPNTLNSPGNCLLATEKDM